MSPASTEGTNRNVIVICLDTVRKDKFDENARDLKDLSDLTYDQCRAASSWTTPSHASFLTGKLPHRHGLHTYNRDFSSLNREDTFLGNLPGFEKYGVSANTFAGPAFGFDTLFDEFRSISPTRRYPDGLDPQNYTDTNLSTIKSSLRFMRDTIKSGATMESCANGIVGLLKRISQTTSVPDITDDGGSAVVRESLSCIENASEPYFLFCNFMEAHSPFRKYIGYNGVGSVDTTWSSTDYGLWELMNQKRKTREYWDSYRTLYEASIQYLDQIVSEFIKEAIQKSTQETIIVITSDHGENLGYPEDKHKARHIGSLSEGLLHVPLEIVSSSDLNAKSTEAPYISSISLPRLILESASGEIPDISQQRIPAEVLGRAPSPQPQKNREYWNRSIRCLYTDSEKYLWDTQGNQQQIKINTSKPNWQRSRRENEPLPCWKTEFFTNDIQEAQRLAKNTSQGSDIDGASKRRLKELGYL